MTTSLTLRTVKGSELTWAELDANFTALRATADAAISVTPPSGAPFGPYATTALLEAAHPAASNAGMLGAVGTSTASSEYVSNGVAWIQMRVAGGLPAYLGQVATRCAYPTALDTTAKQGMFREMHYARDDITSLWLRFDDKYNYNEANSGQPTTVECAVEYPAGVMTRVTFAGANQGVYVAAGTIMSDACPVIIPDGAMFWLRIWKSNAAGMLGAVGQPARLSGFGEAFNLGTTVTNMVMSGTITHNGSYHSTPTAILGMTQKTSVLLVGDSRVVGLQDNTASSQTGDTGEFARSLGGNYGYITVAVSGESAQGFWGNSSFRASLKQYVSHVICNYGINDLNGGGFTLANMQTLYPYIWAALGAPTKPVYQSTLPPVTTSTDSWATVANQTVASWESIRVAVNDWIRTQGDVQLAGIFDITRCLESAENSGKWRPNFAPDGIHEGPIATYAIISSGLVNPALLKRRT